MAAPLENYVANRQSALAFGIVEIFVVVVVGVEVVVVVVVVVVASPLQPFNLSILQSLHRLLLLTIDTTAITTSTQVLLKLLNDSRVVLKHLHDP